MSLSAADLTADQKRAFLAFIREELGEETYRSTLNALGEERLIDAYLARAASESAANPTPRAPDAAEVHWLVQWVITFIFLGLAGASSQIEGVLGDALSGFFIVPFFFAISCGGLIFTFGCGWLLAIAVGGAILGALIGGFD